MNVAIMNSAMKAAGQIEITDGARSSPAPPRDPRRSGSSDKETDDTPEVSSLFD